jgi:DNA-binding LacI/PurR family transcriptional regulator
VGTLTLPQPLASNPYIRIFRIADFSGGAEIARMLLSLGHTRVAFISNHAQDPWANKRCAGLCAEFSKAGFPDAVVPYAMANNWEYLNAIMAPRRALANRVVAFAPGRLTRTALLDAKYPELAATFAGNKPTLAVLKAQVEALAHISSTSMHPQIVEYLREEGLGILRYRFIRIAMSALFERALQDARCTAWVLVNDDAALSALRYLLDRKIRVPGSISLIGFDGDPCGFEYGVSSFDFDFPNICRHMLAFIGHPLHAARQAKGQTVELPGFIVRRDSIGRAHGFATKRNR